MYDKRPVKYVFLSFQPIISVLCVKDSFIIITNKISEIKYCLVQFCFTTSDDLTQFPPIIISP